MLQCFYSLYHCIKAVKCKYSSKCLSCRIRWRRFGTVCGVSCLLRLSCDDCLRVWCDFLDWVVRYQCVISAQYWDMGSDYGCEPLNTHTLIFDDSAMVFAFYYTKLHCPILNDSVITTWLNNFLHLVGVSTLFFDEPLIQMCILENIVATYTLFYCIWLRLFVYNWRLYIGQGETIFDCCYALECACTL